jgi:hypothetical protein
VSDAKHEHDDHVHETAPIVIGRTPGSTGKPLMVRLDTGANTIKVHNRTLV